MVMAFIDLTCVLSRSRRRTASSTAVIRPGLVWGRERGRGDKPISSNGFYCALVLLLTKVEEEYHRMLDVGINTRLLRVDANLDCIIDCAVTRG